MIGGWIGVDLDGTLAEYSHWQGATHIGAPIPAMVERVKQWLAQGKEVRIMTARVYADVYDANRQRDAAQALLAIQDCCKKHFGKELPVTCTKDFSMIELWDDRAVQVEANTGEPIGYSTRGL